MYGRQVPSWSSGWQSVLLAIQMHPVPWEKVRNGIHVRAALIPLSFCALSNQGLCIVLSARINISIVPLYSLSYSTSQSADVKEEYFADNTGTIFYRSPLDEALLMSTHNILFCRINKEKKYQISKYYLISSLKFTDIRFTEHSKPSKTVWSDSVYVPFEQGLWCHTVLFV